MQLAAALADQPDHQHLGVGARGDHRQERRLADAGAGEDAHPLAVAAGREQVERAHAQRQPWPQTAPALGRDAARLHGIGAAARGQRRAAVDRARHRVEHAAAPMQAGAHHPLAAGRGPPARRGAIPVGSSYGTSCTPASPKPTISARSASRIVEQGDAALPCRRRSIRQTSPTPARPARPLAVTVPPPQAVTRPPTRWRGIAPKAAIRPWISASSCIASQHRDTRAYVCLGKAYNF